ncbi:Smr domain-containing protein [Metamycoplasma subdolum]|uniref:Smr domain-containing protein n=1 Tax=Metamycoplasma subdolum TaxID=92407 RepID=A0A3M0A9K5_9BACT|nr:Smr/MutS family protein [Metamycoplasma subdolum]RMA79075.1 Smr domain-containing protein [Metamycoplasma subdolum]WPB50598.1 Smr/MutS family protein [Metamycoplasma subdolum]
MSEYFVKKIDLHGLSVSQATAKVLNALFEFNEDSYLDFLDIMVGNGTGALKLQVETLLEEEGYSFTYLNQTHSLIRVKK